MVLLVQKRRQKIKNKIKQINLPFPCVWVSCHPFVACVPLPILFQGFPTQFYFLLRQGRMKIPLPPPNPVSFLSLLLSASIRILGKEQEKDGKERKET